MMTAIALITCCIWAFIGFLIGVDYGVSMVENREKRDVE